MSKWAEVMRGYDDDIKNAADDYVEATNILPFSVGEIQSVFTESEMEEVAVFVKEMKIAANNNQKQGQLMSQYSKVAVGLLKLARVLV